VYDLKLIDIFFFVGGMCFLGGWQPKKGCQGVNYLSWRLRAAKVTILFGGSSLPRKAINLVVK